MRINKKKQSQHEKEVHIFTKFATMKFYPNHFVAKQQEQQQQNKNNDDIYSKVRNYLGMSPINKSSNTNIRNNKLSTKSSADFSQITQDKPFQLKKMNTNSSQTLQSLKLTHFEDQQIIKIKHLHKLTNQHFLIGDQTQIDVINLNCIVNDYVDTQLVWSLNIGKKILLVAIDLKRSIFVIITDQSMMIVYEYSLKRSNQKPNKLSKIKIQETAFNNKPKFTQFTKDGQLFIFYDTCFEVYIIDGNIISLKKRQNYLQVKHHNLKLYKVPQLFQTKINIFFEQQHKANSSFSLWCLDIDIFPTNIKMNQMIKIYDLQKSLKNQLQIQNYSKDIILLNLGFEIYAIKKGYVIDSANVNIQSQMSFLTYLGNNRLIHITRNQVYVYKFFIKQVNPPKIEITSIDSIVLPEIGSNYQYIRILQMFSNNFSLFYQLSSENNSLVGQTRYKFCLTKKISYQQKLTLILPTQEQLQSTRSELIEEKCDILRKMGLTNREIYLKIWNISKKQKVKDFKFLLSTDHYETIKQQIQKKLRKTSMSYRELHTIQKVCCQMLSQNVYGPHFNIIHFKNFLISHFLIKKYQIYFQFSKIDKLYKTSKGLLKIQQDKQTINDQQNKQILINIQNYHKFSKADIKSILLQYISEYCIQQKLQFAYKIRTILNRFKFSLRIDYFSLISQAIRLSHNNFIVLLKNIPQILPYKPEYEQQKIPQDPQLFEGVWCDITNQDWQKNLHKQKVVTVYNKQILEQNLISDVWYRRNWNTLHDCIFLTKNQILQIHNRNKSEEIFYLVISEVYERINGYERMKELFNFIQNFYAQVPGHLKNKIFLYKSLYHYFKQKQIGDMQSLKQFLKLQDFQLFKLIFRYQKTFKNIIFTQIKPLFKQICGDDQTFNQGLLNYYNSQLSEVSDVKYLLNRMNNKKKQFHQQNEQTYEVLVKAMQSKIKIGSQNDIPIDQVLIYIQNIPLSPDNQIMEQLHIIQQINEETQTFRQMKLNMSIYEIINNPDSVISALIQYSIQKSNILQMTSYEEIKNQTYRIIAETQAIKQKIYTQEQSDLTFFIYLTKILQHQKMITHAKLLLEDSILAQYYTIDQMMIQNLVLFMYKLKFSIQPVYINNQTYILKLVELLPIDNQCRKFIQNQIFLGVYLSPPKDPLWYPMCGPENIISVFQIQSYINNLPAPMLSKIDAKLIWQKAHTLQEIASDGEIDNISINCVYQFIILKLISIFQLRQAIKKTKQCFENGQSTQFDFLYPALILSKVYHQFCQQNRQLISLCCRYQYHDPKSLIQLLQNLMNHKYSSQQQKQIILKQLQKVQKNKSLNMFTSNNLILDHNFTQLLNQKNKQNKQNAQKKQTLSKNFNTIIIDMLKRLTRSKDQFKTFQYHIIFVTLCNDPYVLVKYAFLQRFQINFKNFRCFLSYLIREEMFNKLNLLQFGKRLFKILHTSINQQIPIDQVIQEYRSIPLTQYQEIQRIRSLENQMDRKISKSLERFKNKFKTLKNQNYKQIAYTSQQAKQKIQHLVDIIKNPLNQIIEPFKYIFHDSDDDIQNKEQQVKRQEINKKPQVINSFDAKLERTLLMSRRLGNSKYNMYISMEKPMTTNMFFSQNFGIKGVQLNSLVRSKKFPTLKKSKGQFTNQKSMSAFQSGIVKPQAQKLSQFQSQLSPDIHFQSDQKPKRKFAIAKVQSQYVNLDDFLKFQKLIRSVDRQTTNKESQVPSINEIQVQRQLKMEDKKISAPQSNRYLLADRKFSKIRKISEEIPDQGSDFPTHSNLTNNKDSQQSIIQIQIGGQQNVQLSDCSNKQKQIIDQIFINQITQEILKMITQQSITNIQIHSQILERQRHNQRFNEIIKIVIEKLYEQNKQILNILNIINVLKQKYPEASIINKNFLSIYIKMAQLHSKFSLKFPFKKVFVSSGIYSNKKVSSQLFDHLSPFIESQVDQQNVIKMAKVLSLGFQKSQIELDVYFLLLKKYIKQISVIRQKITHTHYVNFQKRKEDISFYNSQISKIQYFIEKVPVNLFIQKDKDIFAILNSFGIQSKIRMSQASSSSDFKYLKEFSTDTFIQMVIQILRKRGQNKISQMLKSKWDSSNIW